MDILSARKKAAELARSREKTLKEAASPETAAQRPAEPSVPSVAAPPPAAPPAPVEETPAPKTTAAVAQTVSDEKPTIPDAASTPVSEEKPQEQEIEMLSFRLGQEEYALMVEDVKEVLKNRELTAVPNSSDYIPGVTALRGTILPVIDLSKRLGVPSGVRDDKSRILVVNLDEEDVGIIVDRVTGVVKIHPEMIRPVPETIEHGAEFLRGIARKDEKLYILLDRQKALGA